MFEAPRGTHDVLPSEQPAWRRVIGAAEDVCRLYGYRPIHTPVFEDTEVFARTSGAGSDVVQKEMYTFEDRARPLADAATGGHGADRPRVPRARHASRAAAGEALHGRDDVPLRGAAARALPRALAALGRGDRHRRPGDRRRAHRAVRRPPGPAGRRRATSSSSTRSAIASAVRPTWSSWSSWLDEHDADLDDEARHKRATSPLRVFDTKNEALAALLADAPKIGDALCDACRDHFEEVRGYLDAFGVAYRLVPTLVRGLDYYTRTTFEFVDEAIGAQSSICGGGRYDYLAEELGGKHTPGIGFGAGIERLLLSLGDAPVGGRRDRRVLRARGGRRPCGYARGDDGAPTGRARLRRRLRRPLPQGSAHAGEPAGGARGRRRRRRIRISRPSSRGFAHDLARPDVRRRAAGARGAAAHARPAGRIAGATTAASSSSTSATGRACASS